jgi:hypothetical protein
MHKSIYLSAAISLGMRSVSRPATVYTDDFSTSTVKTGSYADSTDDGKWVWTAGFGSIEDGVPDSGVNVGNELRIGYPETMDLTLPVTTGTWDSTQLYTISANFRAFDATHPLLL